MESVRPFCNFSLSCCWTIRIVRSACLKDILMSRLHIAIPGCIPGIQENDFIFFGSRYFTHMKSRVYVKLWAYLSLKWLILLSIALPPAYREINFQVKWPPHRKEIIDFLSRLLLVTHQMYGNTNEIRWISGVGLMRYKEPNKHKISPENGGSSPRFSAILTNNITLAKYVCRSIRGMIIWLVLISHPHPCVVMGLLGIAYFS